MDYCVHVAGWIAMHVHEAGWIAVHLYPIMKADA